MKPAPEDFDELLKLLSLKRHEQPLPGFFDGFSDQIIARIKAESAKPVSGWRQWLAIFAAKPVLAGAYSLAVCGLLLFGLSLSQLVGEQPAKVSPDWALPAPMTFHPVSNGSPQNLAGSLEAAPSSVAPVLDVEPPPGLFTGASLKVRRAGFESLPALR